MDRLGKEVRRLRGASDMVKLVGGRWLAELEGVVGGVEARWLSERE